MERVTGKPVAWVTLRGVWRREDWIGLGVGLVALTLIVLADALLTDRTQLTGSYVAAPFLCALLARAPVTLLVGLAAVALGIASRQWHPTIDAGFWVALAILIGGTMFAVATARNRSRSRVRGERLQILDAVATFADGSRPLDETLDRVTALIVPSVADICIIDAIHPGGVTTAAVRAEGHPQAEEAEERLRRRPPPLPKWLLTGERQWRHIPRWRPRVSDEELRRMTRSDDDFEFLASLGICSAVVVPIAARDRNLGALTLFSAWSRRRYTEDDVRFAQIAARRIGLALDNAGLFSDLESVERRMHTVMSILDEAVMIHAREGDMVFANPAAAEMMGFSSQEEAIGAASDRIDARLTVRDEDGRRLGVDALIGGGDGSGAVPPPLILRVVERDSGTESWYRRRSQAIEGPGGTPLYIVTAFQEVTDVKRAEFAQALLARTGELLASSIDYGATLRDAARIAVPELADWCAVYVPAPGGEIELLAIVHADRERERWAREENDRHTPRIDGDNVLAEVIRSGRPQVLEFDQALIAELARDEDHLELLRQLELRSAIIAPMTAGGTVVGAIAFVNERSSRSFDAADLEIGVELGRRAGLAIENARIAGERARVAEALQRELLPPDLPEMEGWEVATMYRPAGEMNEVGGDFYEAFAVADGWAVVLGDITGHGPLAASLTAVARHSIRAAIALSGDPAAGLRILDQRLRERDAVALCSVAVVLLPRAEDGGEAEARIWLAGHPPPFLLRDGLPREVGRPGPLAGIGENPEWKGEPVRVAPGDQLVIYTDGVIEAQEADGRRFGTERLRRRLASCEEPAAAVAGIESALARLAGGDGDDATLVAIRRLAAQAASPAGDEIAALEDAPQ